MNTFKISKILVRTVFAAGVAIGGFGGLASTLYSAEPTDSPPVSTNTVTATTSSPDAGAKPVAVKRPITGAELYSINCNRCHQERYPTERTGAQWKTIMLHMQVRANIPVSQSKLILQYLQENSGR